MDNQPDLNLIGQDTEFFLWDTEKDRVVPSYEYFGEKKDEPQMQSHDLLEELSPEKKNSSAYYRNSGFPSRAFRDGLAVEVNSYPESCRAWLWQDIKLNLTAQHHLKKLPPHIRFTSRPVAKFPWQWVKKFPADLKILGCSPTLDAYTQSQKAILVDPAKLYWRTSGAHLHASFSRRLNEDEYEPIIKLADLLIGLPFTYVFGDAAEFKRRTLYGQAGEFRLQNYPSYPGGVEYRALSSRLYNHPATFGLFTGLWKYVVLSQFKTLWYYWDPSWEDDLREAINLGTPKLFPKLLNEALNLLVRAGTRYSLGYFAPSLPSPEIPPLWAKLRELNLKGEFPDCGVLYGGFPEAHKGWNEYRSGWKI